ncbi:MAG: hypothetical protein K9M55_08400 [Candidatus Marinimicrobia bacterium]|nr:hypothetical protein [Candidatus Neomarinimicrobiota bacterium]MCF7922708.1 hypothetical protein [Candidatus Neomarinimicrobiota bacterium]
MKRLIFLVFSIWTISLQAQLLRPSHYSLAATDTVYNGLIGSSISDIAGSGDTLWLGSGHGLSATYDNGDSFIGFSPRYSNLGRGGVSALAVQGDTIWAAMGFDSTTAFGDLKAGGGISRSVDGGASWTRLGQPMDSLQMIIEGSDTSYAKYSEMNLFGVSILTVDVVTEVQNITYDLAYDGTRLWATSFGGGLRVSFDLGDSWQRVMLPWDDQARLDSNVIDDMESEILDNPEYYALDPLIHFNHIAFAVKAWNDTVWVGTSGGVNRSVDGGVSWDHFTFNNSNISGNWVIALDRQSLADGSERIWASTITTGAGDVTGLSFYDDETNYWRAPHLGYRVWNIGSDAHNIYAATDQGLWKSKDGLHFVLLPNFHHDDYSEIIYSDAVYSVLVNHDGAVWVGTGDGLAVSNNEGLSWNIHKARSTDNSDEFYAYPNPFTPRYDKVLNGQGNLIIRYSAEAGETVSINVFDFAMHGVREVMDNIPSTLSGPQERTWNGRNEGGYLVSNGTYFIRIEVDSDIHWTKVMVIN